MLQGWRFFTAFFLLQTSLTTEAKVESFFNQKESSSYRDPYRGFVRNGDNLEKVIIDSLSQARKRAYLAFYELRLPMVAEKLIELHKKGIDVRVILDNSNNKNVLELRSGAHSDSAQDMIGFVDQNRDGNLSRHELLDRDAIYKLRAASVPTIDDTADGSRGSGLMHHKFLLVDDDLVVLSSANLTLSGVHGDYNAPNSRGNANAMLRSRSSQLHAVFLTEFLTMWGDGPGGRNDSRFGIHKPLRAPQPVRVGRQAAEVAFGPTSKRFGRERSAMGFIERRLLQARRSIETALFVFSDQGASNVMERVFRNGVQIRSLIDTRFVYRHYSSALDMVGVELRSPNCAKQENNHVWERGPRSNVGYPELNEGDKLHHKFAVLDDDTVLFGSFNWSEAANHLNDEFVVAIEDRATASAFKQEFSRLYRRAKLGITDKLRFKLDQDRNTCSR